MLAQGADLRDVGLHLRREPLVARLLAELGGQLALDAAQLADALCDVRRQADRAARVVEAALQRLADPDRRVGREPVALAVVELLGRADEAEHALLDEVAQGETLALVVPGHADDETQVGVDQLVLRREVTLLDPLRELDDLLVLQEGIVLRTAEQLVERGVRQGAFASVVDSYCFGMNFTDFGCLRNFRVRAGTQRSRWACGNVAPSSGYACIRTHAQLPKGQPCLPRQPAAHALLRKEFSPTTARRSAKRSSRP